MYDCMLNEMADQLIKDGVIAAEQRDSAFKSLANYWEDKIAATWNVEDVYAALDSDYREGETAPPVTREKAIKILQLTLRRMDASVGINWDKLRDAAESLEDDD